MLSGFDSSVCFPGLAVVTSGLGFKYNAHAGASSLGAECSLVQHACLSRRRSRVQIPSLPPNNYGTAVGKLKSWRVEESKRLTFQLFNSPTFQRSSSVPG